MLSDPPFSRIDLVSCRNLLIYLGPEAQAKVIALFHFALRPGGILVLGSAETPGNLEGRFTVLAKAERIYRQVGRSRPGEIGLLIGSDGIRRLARPGQATASSRETLLSELCRRMVLDAYAPAAVLITRKHECLYLLGAADRYLRVAAGHPTHDLLAMAPPGLRTKLRSAIQQVGPDHPQVTMAGGRVGTGATASRFKIDVRLVPGEGEELILVAFIDEPAPDLRRYRGLSVAERTRVSELELELEATRTELQGAIHNLEISSEEQRAINEEALSVSEEFQSTNEELLTSKEELQSLNEELTALNGQLQETLERQRTTSDDLRNVLYSADVATLFLDIDLNIRFFTPATKALFKVIPGISADRWPICAPWRPTPPCRPMCERSSRPCCRSSARSRPRPVPTSIAASCPTARRTMTCRAWSSPSPTSPSARTRPRPWMPPSARPTPQTRRSRASWRPPATICASRCRR